MRALRLFSTNISLFSRKDRLKNALSIEEFIFRKRVLKLYRRIIRTSYKTRDIAMRTDLIQYARGEFESSRTAKDMDQRKYLLSRGSKEFRDIGKTMGFSLPDIEVTPEDLA